MKLSLVFPPWFKEFGNYQAAARRISTFPPLNLCIVAAIAKKAGWEVQLIDAHIEGLNDDELIKAVGDFNPDLIGLTAATPFYPNAARVARMLKQALGKPIVMGGPHVTYFGAKAFVDGLDYLVIGECETVLTEFLEQFEKGNRYPDVLGIMTHKEEEVFYRGGAPTVSNLDTASLPERSLLKHELYMMGTSKGRKRYTSFQMSRGCPFSCIFCASDLYGKKVRRRSIDNVVEELKMVLHQYKVEHIYFVDDVLTLDRAYIFKLCDAIEKHQLKFTFESSTRADLWDEALAVRLKQCGLVRISFGLESADDHVRELMKKGVSLDSHIVANKINNRLGIETTNSAIIGLPGDTRESINRTVQYICSQRELQHITLNIAIPYPGTEMFKMVERGDHGLKLVEEDFSKFQRYGSAVMDVGDLKAGELIDIQSMALMRIYACWWRWIPIIKRFGIETIFITAFRTSLALLESQYRKLKRSLSALSSRPLSPPPAAPSSSSAKPPIEQPSRETVLV
ncbi:MAG: radical SAM protein [Candidatus Omnitrophica bacterium]|nr:radical SAM protein [Candidatus Omnitrophota bacterium]